MFVNIKCIQERTISKRPDNDSIYEESVWGMNLKHLENSVKILVNMENILYLCIYKMLRL